MGMFYDQGNLPTSSSSQGGVNPNNPVTLKAGIGQINVNDVVFSAADGGLYSLKMTDSAAAANQGAPLFAQNAFGTGTADTVGHRQALVQSPTDKTVYTCDDKNVYRLSLVGKVIASAPLTGFAGGTGAFPYRVLVLSNGNVAIVGANPSTVVAFMVFDAQLLNIVKPLTAIINMPISSGDAAFDAIALSGGGFACAAHSLGGPLSNGMVFAIYDNTGTQVYAPTSIGGYNSTAPYLRLAQAANGNVLCCEAQGSNTLWYAIRSSTGASVFAASSVALTGATSMQDIAVATAGTTFAMVTGLTTANIVVVDAGTGAQIGSTGTITLWSSASNFSVQVVSDGSRYWLAALDSTSTTSLIIVGLWSLTTAGALGQLNKYTMDNGSEGTPKIDMGVKNGVLVVCVFDATTLTTTTNPALAFQTSDNTAVMALSQIGTQFYVGDGSAGTTSSSRASLLLVDDFVVLGCLTMTGTGPVIAGCKAIDTAIEGVALSAVAAGNRGTAVQVVSGPGVYSANTISGSAGKAFDHTSTNIAGCKGTVFVGGLKITQ